MKIIFVMTCLFGMFQLQAQNILPADVQIKTAVLAAPEDQRANVTVLGYDSSGKLITLREGSGQLICLADDPNKKGISVACYSKKLEPFMARGRELLAEGKTEAQKQEIRKAEADAGTLKMPDAPSMLYVLTGKDKDYNKATGEVQNAHVRYVIYVPYATLESTGLAPKPSTPGMPWLMDPGSYKAHIMITPPRE